MLQMWWAFAWQYAMPKRYAKFILNISFSIKVATKAYSERVHIFTVYASVFFLSHFKKLTLNS